MDAGPVLPLFDAWYQRLVHRIFDDELGKKGFELLAAVDAPIVNYHPESGGGFWFDFSSYVRNILDRKVRNKRFAHNPCDDTETKKHETCLMQVHKSLKNALKTLREEQGDDMSQWSQPAENINFSEQGLGSASIPWQNRGTENHLVEVKSNLP
jgi:acyl-homoserine lactone acylase PvdQ